MTTGIKNWIIEYDNGLPVESVSMGGLGDGYESAIQDCAIEMMRNLPSEIPENKEEFGRCIKVAEDVAVKKLNNRHGFSGAQVGAAGNLSAVFWRRTPLGGLQSMREKDPERIIKIQKGEKGIPVILTVNAEK